MYEIILDDITFPIAPSEIIFSKGSKNDEMILISGASLSIPRQCGVVSIKFSVLLPVSSYINARYTNGFEKPDYYIGKIEKIKNERRAVKLQIIRKNNAGKTLYNTSEVVTIEDFCVIERAENGNDAIVELLLKTYKELKTQSVQLKTSSIAPRPVETKPSYVTHTVVKGDALWAIANKYLKNGNRYKDVYKWNKETIDKGNYGTGNPTYTIYPKQVLIIYT